MGHHNMHSCTASSCVNGAQESRFAPKKDAHGLTQALVAKEFRMSKD